MNILNNAKKNYLTDALLFCPVIFYTPFFFALVIPQWFRVGSFLLLSAYLFLSCKHFYKYDERIFFTFILLILCMIISTGFDLDNLMRLVGKCHVLFFAWSLKRYLTIQGMEKRILDLYVAFFNVAAIFSIFSVFYLITLGEFDLFGLKSDDHGHLVTPFGVIFQKYFYTIQVYRSFFYFNEPIFVAVFYAFNIVLISPLIKKRANLFAIFNFLGGVISMSMTFYVVLFLLLAFKKIKSYIYITFTVVGGILIFWIIQELEFLRFSSYDDRVERFLIFFNHYIQSFSVLEVFFGEGVHSSTQFDLAFNSGLTVLMFEAGIIGFLLHLIFLKELSNSFTIFIFFILIGLFVVPMDMPIFWVSILLASQLPKSQLNAKPIKSSV